MLNLKTFFWWYFLEKINKRDNYRDGTDWVPWRFSGFNFTETWQSLKPKIGLVWNALKVRPNISLTVVLTYLSQPEWLYCLYRRVDCTTLSNTVLGVFVSPDLTPFEFLSKTRLQARMVPICSNLDLLCLAKVGYPILSWVLCRKYGIKTLWVVDVYLDWTRVCSNETF